MSLRDELEKEMNDAMKRIPLLLEKQVHGFRPSTDNPFQQIKNVHNAQFDIMRVYYDALLRLADEIDRRCPD